MRADAWAYIQETLNKFGMNNTLIDSSSKLGKSTGKSEPVPASYGKSNKYHNNRYKGKKPHSGKWRDNKSPEKTKGNHTEGGKTKDKQIMVITQKLEDDVAKSKISGEVAKEVCNILVNAKEDEKNRDPDESAEETDSSEGAEPEEADSGEE